MVADLSTLIVQAQISMTDINAVAPGQAASVTVYNGAEDVELTDSAGNIIAIALGDVTGNAWNYGYCIYREGRGDRDENGKYQLTGDNSAVLKSYDDVEKKEIERTYLVIAKPEGAGGLLGLPKGAENNPERQFLASIRLSQVDTVSLSAFDGADGVRTKDGYYPISDEVQVYNSKQGRFMTLRQGKADYDSFTLYAERTAEKGGKIRVIEVR